MNFKQIYEGWRNKLVPPSELRETIQQVSAERLAICNTCVFHSKNHDTPLRPDAHCTDCGCNLEAKTACLSCDCPKRKWVAVMNDHNEFEQFRKDAHTYEPEANS